MLILKTDEWFVFEEQNLKSGKFWENFGKHRGNRNRIFNYMIENNFLACNFTMRSICFILNIFNLQKKI